MFEKYKKAIKIERTGDNSYLVFFLLPVSNITTTVSDANDVFADVVIKNATDYDDAEQQALKILAKRLKDFTETILPN
jgi:hypothetical protein